MLLYSKYRGNMDIVLCIDQLRTHLEQHYVPTKLHTLRRRFDRPNTPT